GRAGTGRRDRHGGRARARRATAHPAGVLPVACATAGKPGEIHAWRRPQDRCLDRAAQDSAGAVRHAPGRSARLLQRQHLGRAAPAGALMKSVAQIAAQLQGYDPQALSAGQVNEFLARLVEPVTQTEAVGIFDALDRVLAQDLVSPISVPPHDNSAMDGFAFDGAQLNSQAPLELEVVGTALAGKAWQGAVGPRQCVKIMTGAIMPAGLDTVVPQEFTRPVGENRIAIPPKV